MNKIHPEILHRFGRDPKIVFERDGWKCLICSSKDDLTIDHIDGNGRHSKHPNNDISNLRTLCRKCHGSVDGKRSGRYRWKEYDGKVLCICKNCKKEFMKYKSWVIQGRGIFCSRNCRTLFNRARR